MVETGKVPYQPSQTHRFIISPDKYSQERFAAIKTAVAEVTRQYPAFVDVVLLGSLSKGKVLTPQALAKTDIDIVYFLDSDRAVAAHTELAIGNDRYREYVKMLSSWDPMSTDKELALSIHTHLALDLTEQVIDSALSAEHRIDFKTSTINAKPIALGGDDSILKKHHSIFWGYEDWTSRQARIEEVPTEMAHWVSDIAVYWGWDVNGGLRSYREAFFKDLAALDGETREINWKVIDNYVRFWERKYQIPPQLQRFYPQTFNEAKEFYLNPEAFANSVKT